MKSKAFLALAFAWWALLVVGLAADADWQVISVAGRDYLSFENVARFYQLKLEQDPADRHLTLADGRVRVETCKNPQELVINGVRHWLSFPSIVQNGQMLVSRFDLAKTLEPTLRPGMIGNLEAFNTVVLDAGHGGQDGGGRSATGLEKQYTMAVVEELQKSLQAKGFKVVLTRYEDAYLPLEGRADFSNHVAGSVLVSVHFNSSYDPGANGFEVFAMTPRGAASTGDPALNPEHFQLMPGNDYDNDSLALATCVHHSLLGHINEADRGVKRARFAVLRLTHAPAILIEGGFLTNGAEGRRINDPAWRHAMAESIAVGIKSYRDLAAYQQTPRLMADYRSEHPPLGTAIVNSPAAAAPNKRLTAVQPVSDPQGGR